MDDSHRAAILVLYEHHDRPEIPRGWIGVEHGQYVHAAASLQRHGVR